MILDLYDFIDSLIKKKHELILCIDVNELNNKSNNGVSQLMQLINLIDIIDQKHDLYFKNQILGLY